MRLATLIVCLLIANTPGDVTRNCQLVLVVHQVQRNSAPALADPYGGAADADCGCGILNGHGNGHGLNPRSTCETWSRTGWRFPVMGLGSCQSRSAGGGLPSVRKPACLAVSGRQARPRLAGDRCCIAANPLITAAKSIDTGFPKMLNSCGCGFRDIVSARLCHPISAK